MRTPGSGAFATTHKLPKHLQIEGDLITPKNFMFLIECKKGYKFTISDLMNTTSEFWNIVRKLEHQSIKQDKNSLLIFQQDREHIYCLITSDLIDKEKDWLGILKVHGYSILEIEYFLECFPRLL